jgi:hypothetical protein
MHSMTIPPGKDCHVVSKAFEAALIELERLSERSEPIPDKSVTDHATDGAVTRSDGSTGSPV